MSIRSVLNSTIQSVLHEPNLWTQGSSIACLAVASEAAIRVISEIIHHPSLKGQDSWKTSGNLAASVFFAACGLNVIPGAARCGALAFVVFSAFTGKEGPYFLSRAIALPASLAFEHVIFPVVKKIAAVVSAILEHIPLPEHPMWAGVTLLGGAVFIYKVSSFAMKHLS